MLVYFLFRKFMRQQYNNNSKMGNTTATNQQRFHSRYAFLEALQDKNFGLVKIYRKKQINFDYVMVFERRLPTSQLSHARQEIENVRRSHTLENDVALLRIMNVEEMSGGMCQGSALRIYMEYLNITLKDMIVHRKGARQPFLTDQIMYVIQSALKAYQFLKKMKANHLTLRPDTVYVNPEDGMVRFNPVRIDPFPAQIQKCGVSCLPEQQEVYFEKSQRQFLYQLKSLVLDLVEISSQQDINFRKNYQLLSNINRAKTLPHVLSCLWQPEVQSLREGKRADTTQISGSFSGSRTKIGLSPFSIDKGSHPSPQQYAKYR